MTNYKTEQLAQDEKWKEIRGTVITLPQKIEGELVIDYSAMIKRDEDYLLTRDTALLEAFKKDVGDMIESLKTDERKIAIFGERMDSWEARSYDEKMLVNAILKDVSSLLKDYNPEK